MPDHAISTRASASIRWWAQTLCNCLHRLEHTPGSSVNGVDCWSFYVGLKHTPGSSVNGVDSRHTLQTWGVYSVTRLLHHHWAAEVSRRWAIASACRPKLTCLVLSSDRSCSSSIVQIVSPQLSWSPVSFCHVVEEEEYAEWSPRGDRGGPSVVFGAVGVPWLSNTTPLFSHC